MKFFHNRIANPAGQSASFEDWISSFLEKTAEEKTAREAKPECNDDPRGQCRGQVINNDNEDGAGYQKGDSVDGKKEQGGNARKDTGGTTDAKDNKQSDKEAAAAPAKTVEANCGKEMGHCDDAGKVTEKHTPAGSTESGAEDKKGKTVEQNINNDPNYQKGESVTMKKKDEKKSKKASSNFKQVSSLDRNQKIAVFAQLASDRRIPLAYVEALLNIKVSNMTAEEKEKCKAFWLTQFPADYVELMFKDR